ncbi:MAG: hypothetical protein WBL63_25165 [Candidatus Acidiferrum sp.]
MACPYFMPVEKLAGTWPHPSRLPLGCGWRGHCTAPGHENETPAPDILEAFCNLGYAGGCSWAPQDRAWDAVRFAVVAPTEVDDRRESAGIRVIYVCERNHRPVERGELEFDPQRSQWLRCHDDARLQKMADCFLGSFLQKRS